jgi:high-affinity iron transporter
MQGVFVGTFLIGVREGLEAALIVGIVAAFLRRNGHSLRPMFIGVGLAILISIGVGLGLEVLSTSLPQRQQEMLETVIGAIAVVFVTTMIVWMNRHAFQMKGELEREAQQAINHGSSLALAGMAFLAVLKEGFETSVFLLAAIQASGGGRLWAVLGAVAGIAVAIGIGVGLYYGGLKLNLGRFFKVTGVFLVFIAAGLVLSSLRTAHEAGWITIGQQRVADLSSWMPTRSVLGALITGMFGIPTDPRLVEVLGWLFYAIPVLVIFLWSPRWAATPRARRRLLAAAATVLLAAATALAILVPLGGQAPGSTRTAAGVDGRTVQVTLIADGQTRALTIREGPAPVHLQAAGQQNVDGVTVDIWQARTPTDPELTSSTVTLAELAKLVGGRLPVGLTAARTPGPFAVQWSATAAYTALSHGASLVRAEAISTRVATLTGGGLNGTKTVSVGALGSDWSTSADDDQAVVNQISHAAHDRSERMLWKVWLPVVLVLGAIITITSAIRTAESGNERKSPDHARTQRAQAEVH